MCQIESPWQCPGRYVVEDVLLKLELFAPQGFKVGCLRLVERNCNCFVGSECLAVHCHIRRQPFNLDLMSSKDADKFIESGWIASGACEVVPASLWLILVETSLIGEQLILKRCGGFNR